MTDPNDRTEALRQQLTLTWELVQTFFDWRHKVMTRFAVATAAVLLATRYLRDTDAGWKPKLLVHAIGFVVAIAALAMDRANQRVLYACYANGVALEDRLRAPGVFHHLEQLFWPPANPGGRFARAGRKLRDVGRRITRRQPIDARDRHRCRLQAGRDVEDHARSAPPVLFGSGAQYRLILVGLYGFFAAAFFAFGLAEAWRREDTPADVDVQVANPCDVAVDVTAARRDGTADAPVRVAPHRTWSVRATTSLRALHVAAPTPTEVDADALGQGTYVIPASACAPKP